MIAHEFSVLTMIEGGLEVRGPQSRLMPAAGCRMPDFYLNRLNRMINWLE